MYARGSVTNEESGKLRRPRVCGLAWMLGRTPWTAVGGVGHLGVRMARVSCRLWGLAPPVGLGVATMVCGWRASASHRAGVAVASTSACRCALHVPVGRCGKPTHFALRLEPADRPGTSKLNSSPKVRARSDESRHSASHERPRSVDSNCPNVGPTVAGRHPIESRHTHTHTHSDKGTDHSADHQN